MNVVEITVGKLISPFGFFVVLVIDSEMPFFVFAESRLVNEFILLFGRWLVFRSNVSFIGHEMPFLDQFFRAFEHAPFRLIHLDGASARAR